MFFTKRLPEKPLVSLTLFPKKKGKKSKRKGTVWFRRPRLHTRVQKLGKCLSGHYTPICHQTLLAPIPHSSCVVEQTCIRSRYIVATMPSGLHPRELRRHSRALVVSREIPGAQIGEWGIVHGLTNAPPQLQLNSAAAHALHASALTVTYMAG